MEESVQGVLRRLAQLQASQGAIQAANADLVAQLAAGLSERAELQGAVAEAEARAMEAQLEVQRLAAEVEANSVER